MGPVYAARAVLCFGYGLSSKGSYVGSLVPVWTNVRGGGTFKRWSLRAGGVVHMVESLPDPEFKPQYHHTHTYTHTHTKRWRLKGSH
jgi:hypothetical protein